MKNLILTIFTISLLMAVSSCNSKVADKNRDKAEELAEYKTEMENLRKKISLLEADLNESTDKTLINVDVLPVKHVKYEHFIEVLGTVQSDRNLLVSPESAGNITQIVVKEGDRVSKGQVLAKLNTDALDRSIQEIEVNLEMAKTLFERQETLWNQNIGSEVQYLQSKSNKESLERRLQGLAAQRSMAVITSPVNGVVDDLIQKQGEMASPATPFARIVNLDNIYITADVAEIYLKDIKPRDSVEIFFPVLNKTRYAIIARTSSTIDGDSRTFRIRVELQNSDNQILPNLMAIMKLRTYVNPSAVVVPSILIKSDFTGNFIFVANRENESLVARKKYITRGLNDNNSTVVDSGLEIGDLIITEGYAMIVDGALLNADVN